ncbi:MAG: hypothetical protein WCX31_18235 [Salinivirgaceae bacterium]|jgi:hypothetical protein
MRLVIISLVVFLFNIPFGYWRANVSQYSWQWVLAIHIPVPVIVFMRIYFNIGFAWYTYFFLVAAFFLGQQLGSKLHNLFLKHNYAVSSCLVMDLKKGYWIN